MKRTIFLMLSLLTVISGFSKSNKQLTLVPGGSYINNDDGASQVISISTFLMSNEISNKEFRAFYNAIKNAPNESFRWIDFSTMKSKNDQPQIKEVKNSEIIDLLIDEEAWGAVVETGDYFTNKKYDFFPVVGVTWSGANYYCIWRTKVENEKLRKKKKALQQNYRLPTAYEWEYAHSYCNPKSIPTIKELHKITQGDKNRLGIRNLDENVSEWTSTSSSIHGSDEKVVKGENRKIDGVTSRTLNKDTGDDYVGFRIVQSVWDNTF